MTTPPRSVSPDDAGAPAAPPVHPIPCTGLRSASLQAQSSNHGLAKSDSPLPNQTCQRTFLFLQPAIYECPLELSQMRTEQPFIAADIAPMRRDAESVYTHHILPSCQTAVGARYPIHRRISGRRRRARARQQRFPWASRRKTPHPMCASNQMRPSARSQRLFTTYATACRSTIQCDSRR
jgi:hypothetical protein